jgi:sulfur-oxidizing protein SoxY
MVQSATDPLASPIWAYLKPQLFDDAPVRFDDRLRIVMPGVAENQRAYPVLVDGRGLGAIDRIKIFSDLSPAQLALTYDVSTGEPFVGTRIKLDQRTPVRGAVRLKASGDWIVNGGWIDAAGGGCSRPPVSRVAGNWAQTIGQIRGKAWRLPDGVRLRLAYKHPMDTGFVDNITAFYIESVTVKAGGTVLAQLDTLQSVSEDPAFTMLLRTDAKVLDTEARDTGGNVYAALVGGGD